MTKTPFNDPKHLPTRAEIDLELGVLGALRLKEFEHRCDLLAPGINWSFYWHNPEDGWSYRASYRRKVLCIVHFARHVFWVTVAVPVAHERAFHEIRELTALMRQQFARARQSPGSRWVDFRVGKPEDIPPLMAVLKMKIAQLEGAAGGPPGSEQDADEKERGEK